MQSYCNKNTAAIPKNRYFHRLVHRAGKQGYQVGRHDHQASKRMRIELAAFYKTFGDYILLTPERYIVHNVQIAKSIPNNVFLVLSLSYSISICIAV